MLPRRAQPRRAARSARRGVRELRLNLVTIQVTHKAAIVLTPAVLNVESAIFKTFYAIAPAKSVNQNWRDKLWGPKHNADQAPLLSQKGGALF